MRAIGVPGRTGICFITDRHATGGRPLLDVVRAAVAGGVDVVQIRERDLDGRALLDLVKAALDIAKSAGGRCRIVVNNRLDVALAAKAAGVHLPAEGLPVGAVKGLVPKRFMIGRSIHSLAEAREAEKAGVGYLIFGPVFETPSKAEFGPPHGPQVLRKVAESVRIPIWAIGGIDAERAIEIRGLPIAGIAAIRAIAAAMDPAQAVRDLRAAVATPSS